MSVATHRYVQCSAVGSTVSTEQYVIPVKWLRYVTTVDSLSN